MSEAKMVSQTIKYSDGTETVINYTPDGVAIETPEVPVELPTVAPETVEPVETPSEEVVEPTETEITN